MHTPRIANTATFNNASIITPPTHALPLGDNDLTQARKIPFASRHWHWKIKLQSAPVVSEGNRQATLASSNMAPALGSRGKLGGSGATGDAALLLMLGARTTVTPFHHQFEAQHPKNLSAIHKLRADYPIF